MLSSTFFRRALLTAPLLATLSISPVMAQNHGNHGSNNNYYNGVRSGGRGGNYDRGPHDHYNDRRDQGGIGPGKGALIGAGGGAVLGALFGGGLKGAVVGGAAGAGVGAIAGKVNQDNNRRDYRRRDNY